MKIHTDKLSTVFGTLAGLFLIVSDYPSVMPPDLAKKISGSCVAVVGLLTNKKHLIDVFVDSEKENLIKQIEEQTSLINTLRNKITGVEE